MSIHKAVYLTSCLMCLVFSLSNAKILYAQQNHNFNMSCGQNGSAEWWILPNQKIVSENQPLGDRVFLNDSLLFFNKVDTTDEGTYTCAVDMNPEGLGLVLRSVQLRVEPALETGSPWQKYENHFVTGLVAAGVAAGVILFAALVYKFRWRNPSKKLVNSRDDLMPASDIEGTIADERF